MKPPTTPQRHPTLSRVSRRQAARTLGFVRRPRVVASVGGLLAAGSAAALFVGPVGLSLQIGGLTALGAYVGWLVTASRGGCLNLMVTRWAARGLAATISTAAFVAAWAGTTGQAPSTLALVTVSCVSVLAAAVAASLRERETSRTFVIVGSAPLAEALHYELASVAGLRLVGRLAIDARDAEATSSDVPVIGHLEDCRKSLQRGVDLLLLASEVSRPRAFECLTDVCLDNEICLIDIANFYESVLGQVALTEINPTWFQYVLHPRFSQRSRRLKRWFDVVTSFVLLLSLAPLFGLIAAGIWLERAGPVLFRQVRVGEGGREFTMLKFRTMHDQPSIVAWTSRDDPRITTFGNWLRKFHLDELPQLVNVIRGDMSIVGPRPEQPAFVAALEEQLPFYQRRHRCRPGLTGWAQVRCGYGGSDVGSAWKLANDLFYLKRRSLGLDIAILFETVFAVVRDTRYEARPTSTSFLVRPSSWPAARTTDKALHDPAVG